MRAVGILELLYLGVAAGVVLASACTKRGPTDVGNKNPRSEFVDGPGSPSASGAHHSKDAGTTTSDQHVLARPEVHGRKPRELGRASARAIVTSGTHVYFGDGEEDALFGLLKSEGAANVPSRIARRAPMPGALALDEESRLVWVGSPGDVVLRVPSKGGPPTTLRDGAIFANIAVSTKGEIFFTEVQSKGGALSRITGATVARLATFDGSPRGITLDAQHVYVTTSTRIVETPRQRDVVTDLATGSGFASPQVDDTWLYATATNTKGRGRVLVRVKKMGGTLETIAEGVRDAPIALHKGSIYWFDATRPALLGASTSAADGKLTPQTLSEDPLFEYVYGIVIDDDGAFVASGYGDSGRILAIPLR